MGKRFDREVLRRGTEPRSEMRQQSLTFLSHESSIIPSPAIRLDTRLLLPTNSAATAKCATAYRTRSPNSPLASTPPSTNCSSASDTSMNSGAGRAPRQALGARRRHETGEPRVAVPPPSTRGARGGFRPYARRLRRAALHATGGAPPADGAPASGLDRGSARTEPEGNWVTASVAAYPKVIT